MSNETTTGAPLAATVGERLGGDPHVKELREQVEHAAETASAAGGDARPDAGSPPAEAPRRTKRARQAAPRAARQADRAPGEPQQGEPGEAAGHRTRRGAGGSFPWGAFALAALGWAVASAVAGGVRNKARRAKKRSRSVLHGLASRLPGR